MNECDEREKREQGVREQNRERQRVMTGKKRGREEVVRGGEGLRAQKKEVAGEW